jgi:predicted nucleotidyltransferase
MTLEEVLVRLVEVIHPEQVFLFGSRASGTAGPDSDIDLLVVADLPGTRWERTTAVSRALRPRGVSVDLLVYTPEEFRRLAAEPDSFVHRIVATGRLEYDQEDRRVA